MDLLIKKESRVDEVKKALGVLCDYRIHIRKFFYKIAIRLAMLYVIKCWAVKKQHIYKMSVAKMRMLKWINRNNRKTIF